MHLKLILYTSTVSIGCKTFSERKKYSSLQIKISDDVTYLNCSSMW